MCRSTSVGPAHRRRPKRNGRSWRSLKAPLSRITPPLHATRQMAPGISVEIRAGDQAHQLVSVARETVQGSELKGEAPPPACGSELPPPKAKRGSAHRSTFSQRRPVRVAPIPAAQGVSGGGGLRGGGVG
jgi:hypothetical protein